MNHWNKHGKKKERLYCGYNSNGLSDMIDRLCILEEDIIFTEQEYAALDIAIQALTDVLNAVATNGKVVIDG